MWSDLGETAYEVDVAGKGGTLSMPDAPPIEFHISLDEALVSVEEQPHHFVRNTGCDLHPGWAILDLPTHDGTVHRVPKDVSPNTHYRFYLAPTRSDRWVVGVGKRQARSDLPAATAPEKAWR
jgi:hypothetical protein